MKPIKLNQPSFESLELNEVQNVLNSFSNGTQTSVVNDFELLISDYIGASNCLATNSATAALHLSLLALGVQKGDSILCSTFTFAASAFPIKYVGATPVFIDAEVDTWNMCPKLLKQAIIDQTTKGKKPAAIILVHSYGVPAKMDEILKISKDYEIPLIEDAAEALGSTYKGKSLGTFGEFGVFSFNTNKVISTLGGGVLVCKRKKDFELASLFARQGKIEAPHYEHSVVGYNYSMSSIAGALGLAQIKKIIPAIHKRHEIFDYYRDQLKECPNLKFLEVADDTFSNKWMFCVLTPSLTHKENLRLALLAQNIESRPLWKPMHQQTIFKDNLCYLNGVSDLLFQKGVCLPSSSSLSLEDIKRITSVIKNLYVNV